MEKFSKWRDPGTGIHPFLPPKQLSDQSSILTLCKALIKNYTVGPIIGVIKFVLILIVFIKAFLLNSLFYMFPIRMRRIFVRINDIISFRLILLLLGFWWIPTEIVSLQRGRGRKNLSKSNSIIVKSGDIVIANHCSYIDIIYLLFRYSPVFVAPCVDSNKVVIIPWWKALLNCADSIRVSQNGISLNNVVKDAKTLSLGPVILFPEGTTSNGKGLLKPMQFLNEVNPVEVRVHIIGFKYIYKEFSPTFCVGNIFIHSLKLACQLQNNMVVRFLEPKSAEKAFDHSDVDLANESFEVLSTILQLRRTQLGMEDKKAFTEYFFQRQLGRKSKHS